MKKGSLERFIRSDPDTNAFVLDVLGLVNRRGIAIGEAYYSCMTVLDVLRERLDDNLRKWEGDKDGKGEGAGGR